MADLREEIEKLSKKLREGQITSMEDFEVAYATLASIESKENLDDELKKLHNQAEEKFKEVEEDKNVSEEEPNGPDDSKVTPNGEETEKVEEVGPGDSEKKDEKKTTKTKGKESTKKESTKKESTKKESTKKEPTEKAKDSKKKAEKKEEKPKKDRYESKVEKAAEDFKTAKSKVEAAKGDYKTLESKMQEEKQKYEEMKAAIKDGVASGKIKYVDLIKQAKAYNDISKKVSKQIELIGKLNKIKDKAEALDKSMQNFKLAYSDIDRSANRVADVFENKKEKLENRKNKYDIYTKQNRRIELSTKKISRSFLKGVLKKNLTVYPVKKLSFALRSMGFSDLANKLDKKAVDRAKSIDKDTTTKVRTESNKRMQIEDRVDAVIESELRAIGRKERVYTGKKEALEAWKNESINNTSPFKKKVVALAAKREEAAQSKAFNKYKNSLERTRKRLEKDILKEREVGGKRAVKKAFTENIQEANGIYEEKSEKVSKIKRFVDNGNTIREQIDKARNKAKTIDDGRLVEMASLVEEKKAETDTQLKDEKKKFGTKTKLKLAQKGRERRFDNMVFDHDMKGSTRKTAANIAAFLGLTGIANDINNNALDSQKKLLDKRIPKVLEGSRLGKAALSVGEATLNIPEIVGEGVVKGAEYAVGKATEFVESSKEAYAMAMFKKAGERGEEVLAQVAEFEGKNKHSKAQEKVENKTKAKDDEMEK